MSVLSNYSHWLSSFGPGDVGWWEANSREQQQQLAARAKAPSRLRKHAQKYQFQTNRFTAVNSKDVAFLLRVERLY